MSDPDSSKQSDQLREGQHLGGNHDGLNSGAVERPPSHATETPEALKEHVLARPGRSSWSSAGLSGREVTWVRASDALAQVAGRLAGHGITASQSLNRAPRRAVGLDHRQGRETARAPIVTSERRLRLAPPSSYGYRHNRSRRTGISR